MVTETRFSWDRTDDFESPAERLRVSDLDEWDLDDCHPDRPASTQKSKKQRRRIDRPCVKPPASHLKNQPADQPGRAVEDTDLHE